MRAPLAEFKNYFLTLLVLGAGLFAVGFMPWEAYGRPEYAVKHGVVNCAACHASPAGGGIRNVYGKNYGAHGFKPTPHHERLYYQLDVRAMAYTSQDVRTSRNGLGLMEILGSVQVPVLEEENNETTFVATFNFGAFPPSPNLRDSYVKWAGSEDNLISDVVVGVFVPPFGLLTDEHRTYTRFQSRSTWNNYDMGFMVSGNPTPKAHWDLALVNGFQASSAEGAGTFSEGDTYGAYANFRLMPFSRQFMLGVSGSHHQRHKEAPSPYALSLYTGLGLEGLTGYRLRGSLLFEFVRSQYWNDGVINPEYDRQFARGLNGTYVDQLKDQVAEGYYLQFLYDLTRNFSLHYKWDKLIPSTEFRGDYFERFGLGFRHQVSANFHLWGRGEWVDIGRPDVSRQLAPIAHDTYWLLGHFWF